MTAINVILMQGEAHVITDGAAMSGAVLKHARSKALPIPHLRCAVAARGTTLVGEPVLFQVSTYSSVEEMRDRLPRDLKRQYGLLSRLLPNRYAFDLIVAGVDEAGQEWGFSISSLARPGEPAFSLQEIGYVHASPGYDDDLMQRHVGGLNRRSLRSGRDAVRSAASAMVAHQRSVPKDYGLGKGEKFVGCFAQITSVYGDFIETSVVATWPDKIGETLSGA